MSHVFSYFTIIILFDLKLVLSFPFNHLFVSSFSVVDVDLRNFLLKKNIGRMF